MTDRIPTDAHAIIIGAMKCGTSSLYSYLQDHPQICPAVTKEPEFFSEHHAHRVPVERYSELWEFDPAVHRYALEASTGYTKFPAEPNVAKKIFDYGIRPRFIYIIRNPFDRIASHFNYMQKSETWRHGIIDSHLIDTTNYFLQLEQYRRYFPAEDVLLLDFDELRDEPARVLGRIYAFLRVSDAHFPREYEVRNPTRVQSGFEKTLKRSRLGAVLGHAPEPVKQLGKQLFRSAPAPKKRVLTEEERQFIVRELREGMVGLSEAYGFDVRKWEF